MGYGDAHIHTTECLHRNFAVGTKETMPFREGMIIAEIMNPNMKKSRNPNMKMKSGDGKNGGTDYRRNG